MTRLVVLSRARPRNPLTSPAASQRASEDLAGASVGGAPGAQQAARLRACTRGQRRAPRELATMVGDFTKVELHRLAHPIAEAEARAVCAAPERVVLVENDLDAGMLTLGVRVEEYT
jgi:hypothetical protein